jgi:carboxyl-terminal processing protease
MMSSLRVSGALLVILGGVAGPVAAQDRPTRAPTVYEDLQMFSQVLNQLRINHADSLDLHTLLIAAIEGMVRAADPHSYVLPAIRLSPEREAAVRNKKLYPVPIDFAFIEDVPTVLGLRIANASQLLDILPGDELEAIDGQAVLAESAEELDIMLAGEKGSAVRLSLKRHRRDGTVAMLDRIVRREALDEVPAVVAASFLGPRTGYIRLSHFVSTFVAEDFTEAVEALERSGMQQLVLDLRDNGGGLVDQAALVASAFLPKGDIVYVTEERRSGQHDTVRVERAGYFQTLPMVVLVNRGTASAAELIPGALQDHDRAIVLGQPTFGKSLFLRPFPLSDGSIIMLVVGRIKTPCGRVIQRPFRDLRRNDYFRLAGGTRDTTTLPSCRSSGGRTLYGGGGIQPDIIFPTSPQRDWEEKVWEQEIPTLWLGHALAEPDVRQATRANFAVDAPLPDYLINDFLTFARERGVVLSEQSKQDVSLGLTLRLLIVQAKWGLKASYELAARWDREVAAAVNELTRLTGRQDSMH